MSWFKSSDDEVIGRFKLNGLSTYQFRLGFARVEVDFEIEVSKLWYKNPYIMKNKYIKIGQKILLLSFLIGPFLACNQESPEESTNRPNIVFLLVDDLGWNDVGCYGSTFYETPNIDQLAQDGMRFTDAYAACPVCSPTRASILTGKYPTRLNITDWIPGSDPKLSLIHI